MTVVDDEANGMVVNEYSSKTEIIVLWAGKRTNACKLGCNVEGVPGVLLVNGRLCKFVQQYKHRRSMVSATPSPALEIKEKIKKATRAFYALAKEVFLYHEIDIHLHTRLFNAIVVSILLFAIPRFGCLHAFKCDGGTFVTSCACERWADFPKRPFLAKTRLSDAEMLKKMQMPNVSYPIASRRVGYELIMCRCLWTLGSASCLPMMGAQINGHLWCYVTYVPLLSAKPMLETPSMIGPREGSDMIFSLGDVEDNAGKCQSRRLVGRSQRQFWRRCARMCGTSIAQELHWDSLLNKIRVLNAINSLRESQNQSRSTDCEHMDIANHCPATMRMRVLCTQSATNTFRT